MNAVKDFNDMSYQMSDMNGASFEPNTAQEQLVQEQPEQRANAPEAMAANQIQGMGIDAAANLGLDAIVPGAGMILSFMSVANDIGGVVDPAEAALNDAKDASGKAAPTIKTVEGQQVNSAMAAPATQTSFSKGSLDRFRANPNGIQMTRKATPAAAAPSRNPGFTKSQTPELSASKTFDPEKHSKSEQRFMMNQMGMKPKAMGA